MAGLRERQKADRRRRILQAAGALFRRSGYDHARIEDIAERAGVSVGTFYNYFANKGDILLETVSMEVEEVLEAGDALVADPPAGVPEAILALIRGYFEHSLTYLSKEMWRTAMAVSIRAPETPFSRHYTALDRRLSIQVCAMIAGLQARGLVRDGLDPQAVGEVIFNNLNMMFIEFTKDEAMSMETLLAAVERQTRPLAAMISAPPSG
ncbi:TetR/AcrR family transcriptional regulator (plasmid) [Paroceanicella profunda]|uniref:TetR/AcrR family transcriptional regulator n=1 Tax=Paroceanicella profunda TaxID=2579971 RepID=A0A5B8FY58_9RHOB|nr:TetR/AcrR family transcriptional regulator [Paroceanicella profunda]QDL93846.1 TetR/AcrR family transcriptional regulator [Paroceanicella profunda]